MGDTNKRETKFDTNVGCCRKETGDPKVCRNWALCHDQISVNQMVLREECVTSAEIVEISYAILVRGSGTLTDVSIISTQFYYQRSQYSGTSRVQLE